MLADLRFVIAAIAGTVMLVLLALGIFMKLLAAHPTVRGLQPVQKSRVDQSFADLTIRQPIVAQGPDRGNTQAKPTEGVLTLGSPAVPAPAEPTSSTSSPGDLQRVEPEENAGRTAAAPDAENGGPTADPTTIDTLVTGALNDSASSFHSGGSDGQTNEAKPSEQGQAAAGPAPVRAARKDAAAQATKAKPKAERKKARRTRVRHQAKSSRAKPKSNKAQPAQANQFSPFFAFPGTDQNSYN